MDDKLTDEQKFEYLISHGNVCPFCGSEEISDIRTMDVHEDGTASQACVCANCGKKWVDLYSLLDVEDYTE